MFELIHQKAQREWTGLAYSQTQHPANGQFLCELLKGPAKNSAQRTVCPGGIGTFALSTCDTNIRAQDRELEGVAVRACIMYIQHLMELSEHGTLPTGIKVLGSMDVLGSNTMGSYADLDTI